jgi:hypothetical protein
MLIVVNCVEEKANQFKETRFSSSEDSYREAEYRSDPISMSDLAI